jgi:uncharacterized protein (TIGR02996 family)
MPDDTLSSTLKAAIDRDIDNIDAYLVYADYLQQQGDPRGEFILLCHHANDDSGPQDQATIAAARDQYLEHWGDQLLGDLYGPYQRGEVALDWRLGFVDRLTIKAGPDAQPSLDRLPTEPCCRYLQRHGRLTPGTRLPTSFRRNSLIALAYPDTIANDPGQQPLQDAFSHYRDPASALILDLLQPLFSQHLVRVEQRKMNIESATDMIALGTHQTAILGQYLDTVERLGRPDLGPLHHRRGGSAGR